MMKSQAIIKEIQRIDAKLERLMKEQGEAIKAEDYTEAGRLEELMERLDEEKTILEYRNNG